jgi:small subunit ribosomal protein S9
MEKIVTIGRRKTSVARVFVAATAAGSGKITVNKREFENFFPVDIQRIKVLEPFAVTEVNSADYDIYVNVRGGGPTGQAEAVRLGLARALLEIDAEHRPALKKKGLLTRDPRMVERKKFGKAKARKSFQFSKR